MRLTRINEDSELNGANFFYEGVTFQVKRTKNNTDFMRKFNYLQKKNKSQLEGKGFNQKVAVQVMAESLTDTVIVGWHGYNGYEYSTDNCINLLKDDDDLRELIQEFSNDIDNYLDEQLEETVKKP